MDYRLFNFQISIKNLVNIEHKINIIIDENKRKKETEYDHKKKVVSILNEIKNYVLDFYFHHETVFKLTKKYQPQRLDKVLNKYSKHSKLFRDSEDQFNELCKYSKSPSEETTAERVKLMPQKRKRQKTGTVIKILTSTNLLTRLPVLLPQ